MTKPEKQIMHDVVPKDKRSIRNIRLDRSRTSKQPEVKSEAAPPPPPSSFSASTKGDKPKKKWSRVIIIIVGLLVVLFFVLNAFMRATIHVVPRQEEVTIDGTFVASPMADFLTLPYEVFTVTREASSIVRATGEKNVETKAGGTITIFNDFDANDQLLVVDTRFETPEGLIYRITNPVTVPGQHLNGDGELIPGSVEVTVLADEIGEQYNIGLTDFTIPGFEEADDPRFDGFFARSKTVMSGGFSGIQKTIAEDDIEKTREKIDETLREELHKALASDLPEEFVTYTNTSFFVFNDLTQGESEGDTVEFRREGTLHAVVFDKNALAAFIAENTIASYDGAPIVLDNPDNINFVLADKENFNPNTPEEFEFTVSGQVTIVWELDEERLIQDLASKHKNDISTVLSGYPAIDEADVTIYPFWRRAFPEDVEKIKLEYGL